MQNRKKNNQNRKFLVANAQVENYPIIFCNDGFCELVGWSRAALMQRSCTCEFLHGPLTSSVAVAQIKECLASCHEKQLEILYYRKDGTKFLCSQVTAPIRNEEGVICMFIINFEDITNAPYRDAAVSPLPSPARIHRWKKMKLKFSGNRTQPEDHELTAESPESIQHRSKSVTVSGTKDADSQSTKGDYAAPHEASTAVDVEGDTSRSKQFNTTANNLTKSLPNASSDSDLPRYRHKSPSISNDTPEAAAARAAAKENSQSSTTSKFLKDMQAHSKHHVGEKVAQLKILGKVALPLHQEPTWKNGRRLEVLLFFRGLCPSDCNAKTPKWSLEVP
ncbi:potassium voltage-gated channel subfamily H member 2 [Trichonephila clavata]|uniref:Potassium voltage-gated channel subfamily H member 2 n=1 Tax=Trichonephila clavata TaxID=2740835 RepID=A0A8X6G692_TRICU|nr:potassium voltage-gated channel subfamily H member 2 [Trichonephila clavata]